MIILNRRNFLVNILLWILAFFFGYTIKKEGEDLNLFKTDERIILDGDGKKISDKIGYLNEQLAETAKKIDGYINLSSYCVGGGIVDDTTGFLNAKNYAETNKTSIYVDGHFLIKQGFTIENMTIPEIFGDSVSDSSLIVDLLDGETAITAKTYSAHPLKLRNLMVRQKDGTKMNNGLKIDFGSWGGACKTDNVQVVDFTGVVLNIVSGFNSVFNNSRFQGRNIVEGYKATLLKIDKGSSFSNVNTFNNCNFEYGKIAIQNLGGVGYKFNECQFEHNNLFMNLVDLPGMSSRMTFDTCWFENMKKGIINASIDENTVEPIIPIVNKASVNFLKFSNCYSSAISEYILSPIVEPEKSVSFSLAIGEEIIVRKQLPFKNVSLLNGWTGELGYTKNALGLVILYGKNLIPATLESKVSGVTLGYLPDTYKPIVNLTTNVLDSEGGTIAKIIVQTNGEIKMTTTATLEGVLTYSFSTMFYAM